MTKDRNLLLISDNGRYMFVDSVQGSSLNERIPCSHKFMETVIGKR